LKHGRYHIFVSHHSRIEERQPGCHKENQAGSSKHPGNITAIQLIQIFRRIGCGREEGKDRKKRQYEEGNYPFFCQYFHFWIMWGLILP